MTAYPLGNFQTAFFPMLTLATGLAAVSPAAAQGLAGQPVTLTEHSPVSSVVFQNIGTQTVTPSGVTFTQFSLDRPFMTISVTPSKITFTSANRDGSGFAESNSSSPSPDYFVGYVLSEAGSNPATLTGVSVDPVTDIARGIFGSAQVFDSSRVTFDAQDVFVNFRGIFLGGGSNLTLAITTNATAVPEPSSAAIFGLGALGLTALSLRSRRRKAT